MRVVSVNQQTGTVFGVHEKFPRLQNHVRQQALPLQHRQDLLDLAHNGQVDIGHEVCDLLFELLRYFRHGQLMRSGAALLQQPGGLGKLKAKAAGMAMANASAC